MCFSKWKSRIVTVACALLLLSIAGCSAAADKIEEETDNSKVSSMAESRADSGEEVSVHSLLIYDSLQELVERSDAVVYGTVTEISDPFHIKTDYGPAARMDITIEPQQVLRGEEKETYTLRIEAKEIEMPEKAEFQLGERYLLFLYQPGYGGAFYVEDDAYYLMGDHQSVFVPVKPELLPKYAEELTPGSGDTLFAGAYAMKDPENIRREQLQWAESLDSGNTATYAVFSLEMLTDGMPEMNEKYPADPGYHRESIMETYNTNLKNNTIIQEEYDRFMDHLDLYADVLTQEEYEAYKKEYDAEMKAEKDLLRQALAEDENSGAEK